MPAIIPISDPDDPRVAPFRNIRERDLLGRDNLFVAEGEVVLKVLLGRSRHPPAALLVAARRLPALLPLLAGLPETVPVHAAEQAVVDGIAGFHLHRGVLALGRRGPAIPAGALLGAAAPAAIVVCLIGIANHDNVGGIFRNAAAFGAAAAIIDRATCDPLYRKAIRVSVGGTLVVPWARLAPPDDLLALLARHGFAALALAPHGRIPLAAVPRGGRVALLLGAEGAGLPADILARATTVRIPMAADFDSLNVATTSGIVLHHLTAG